MVLVASANTQAPLWGEKGGSQGSLSCSRGKELYKEGSGEVWVGTARDHYITTGMGPRKGGRARRATQTTENQPSREDTKANPPYRRGA